jgi:hypothetical protein
MYGIEQDFDETRHAVAVEVGLGDPEVTFWE